jgi:hypothetical protein
VQVFAAPIEGSPKDFMEFGETGFADHEQSSPHQRTHAAEKDTKLMIAMDDAEGSAMRAFYPSPQVQS